MVFGNYHLLAIDIFFGFLDLSEANGLSEAPEVKEMHKEDFRKYEELNNISFSDIESFSDQLAECKIKFQIISI